MSFLIRDGKKVKIKVKQEKNSIFGYLKMGISLKECHFGWFDKKQLLNAIDILNKG